MVEFVETSNSSSCIVWLNQNGYSSVIEFFSFNLRLDGNAGLSKFNKLNYKLSTCFYVYFTGIYRRWRHWLNYSHFNGLSKLSKCLQFETKFFFSNPRICKIRPTVTERQEFWQKFWQNFLFSLESKSDGKIRIQSIYPPYNRSRL